MLLCRAATLLVVMHIASESQAAGGSQELQQLRSNVKRLKDQVSDMTGNVTAQMSGMTAQVLDLTALNKNMRDQMSGMTAQLSVLMAQNTNMTLHYTNLTAQVAWLNEQRGFKQWVENNAFNNDQYKIILSEITENQQSQDTRIQILEQEVPEVDTGLRCLDRRMSGIEEKIQCSASERFEPVCKARGKSQMTPLGVDGASLVVLHQRAVDPAHAHHKLLDISLCQCRTSCSSSESCVSYSYRATDRSCSLMTELPLTAIVDDPDSTYYYLHYPEGSIQKRSDGLYYFYNVNQMASAAAARAYCAAFPGFAPPSIVTRENLDTIGELHTIVGFFLLGLSTDATTGELTWDNGIPFSTTVANTGVTLYRNDGTDEYHSGVNIVHDAPASWTFRLVCQGNLDGLPWN